jgi:hypothetical protein
MNSGHLAGGGDQGSVAEAADRLRGFRGELPDAVVGEAMSCSS